MKKLIVLGAVVLATTFALTSCGKKETEVTPETTEAPVDTVAAPAVDTTAAAADTTATTVATDTVKK